MVLYRYVKEDLSSIDVRVIVRELGERLVGARLDKVYQVGGREFILKFFGRGSVDVAAAPNFICITQYRRPTPSKPSSFAMQLRKHLSGQAVVGVVQHGFDRIVEFRFERNTLVFELFSRGNVVLCDSDMRILGLLDWQRWRDRTLGVGRQYLYPPAAADPFSFDEASFTRLMFESSKGVAATLASRLSLGGFYAEYVCGQAGVDPKTPSPEVDASALWEAFSMFLRRIDGPVEARVSADNVTPFCGVGESYPSFNEAVDEYFSRLELSRSTESVVVEQKTKLADILRRQEEAYAKTAAAAAEERLRGDLLYQRMGEVDAALSYVREARRKRLSDGEILEGLKVYRFVKSIDGFNLRLDL